MPDRPVESIGALARSQLVAVTFVWDYLQLQFEGPAADEHHHMNLYTHPVIQTDLRRLTWGEPGYRDALCGCIGIAVLRAQTQKEQEQVLIEFENDTAFSVSLHLADFEGPEAAEYTHNMGTEHLAWTVWREDWDDE